MKKRDNPHQVAFNLGASSPERYDAQIDLIKSHRPSVGDLLPNENVQRLIQHIQNDFADQQVMQKGGAQIIQFPGSTPRSVSKGMKSVYLDDLQINAMGDYWEKPGPLQFEAMRSMVEQTPILNAIVLTRIRQVSRFCAPPDDDGDPGFKICHVDREHKPTPEERQAMQQLTRFYQNCGWEFNPRKRRMLKRDSFSQFISKYVRDSLTMDSAAIETEYKRDRRRGIDGFYAVDGSTIRLCSETGYQGDDSIYALQVVQGRIRAAYTPHDLIYEPRNPRTDVRLAGYGLSETELLIRVVTGFLNAMTMNIKGFSENSIPRGILHLVGDFAQPELDAFKRYWNGMVRGVNNAWAMPVMAAKDPDSKAAFEKIDDGFNEMYFAKWMTFLTSIACAIYGIGPEEINFESFGASNRSALSGDDTSEKLANSKDKGFRPLMSHVQSVMSDFICTDFSENLCFRWTGLEEENGEQRFELRKTVLTVNELRVEEGYKPLETAWGNAPANPTLIGAWQAEEQAKQQAQQGGQPGEEQGDFGQDGDKGGGQGGGEPDPDLKKALNLPFRIGGL